MSYRHCKKQLLAWLDGQGHLPGIYSNQAALETSQLTFRRLRQAVRELETTDDIEAQLATVLRAKDKLYVLMEWSSFMDNDLNRQRTNQNHWDVKLLRLIQYMVDSPLMPVLKHQAHTHEDPAWQRALAFVHQELMGSKRVKDERHQLNTQRDRRQERANVQRGKKGITFTDEEVKVFPNAIKATMKEGQQTHRWKANWLPHNHADLYSAMSYLSNERTREVAWECMQFEFTNQDEFQAVMRQRRDQTRAYPSFAHATMRDHVEPRPEMMEKLLHGMLRQLAPAYRQFWTALQEIADQKHGGVDAGRPWNTSFLMTRLFNVIEDTAEGREDLFPVEPTLRKVLHEVLPAVGWTCREVATNVAGVYQFQCENEQGRELSLWVRPHARPDDWSMEGEAQCISLGLPWESHNHPSCAISLCLDPATTSFTPLKIVHLAHEVGHMVHFMSMSDQAPLCDQVFPQDLIELPSQLLEHYVTPERLAAWVRPTASEVYRTEAYWKEAMSPKRDPWTLDAFVTEVFHGALDLGLHQDGRHTFERQNATLREWMGAPERDPRDQVDNMALVWDDEYAGRQAIYMWGKVLIERMLPKQAAASTVARQYRQFMEVIGAPAAGPREVRAAWKAWKEETMYQSAMEGAKALCEKHAEFSQAMLDHNPLLKEVRRAAEKPQRRRRMS